MLPDESCKEFYMRMTPLENRIYKLADPVIEDLGFALVNVKVIGEAAAPTVQIMAEDPATRRLGVDDCAKISRALSAVLDVEDPISSAYRLEISSPGIDRILTREKDFEDYTGFEVKLETLMPNENGQKRYRGVIKGMEEGKILLGTDTGDVEIPYSALAKAKLVLTDDLIKATANL